MEDNLEAPTAHLTVRLSPAELTRVKAYAASDYRPLSAESRILIQKGLAAMDDERAPKRSHRAKREEVVEP